MSATWKRKTFWIYRSICFERLHSVAPLYAVLLLAIVFYGGVHCEDLEDDSSAYSSASEWNSLSIVPVSKNRVYQRALGKSSIFTCTANVEFPERLNDFRWWWPDGRAIEATDTRVEIMKDQPGSLTLLFPAIQEQDLGTYRCTATYMLEDNAQQLKTDFTLRAYVPITFEDAPLNQYATKGQDFIVRCRVRADPEPQVDWKKDHRVINDSDHFIIRKDGVVIRSVTLDDEGVYTCRVRVTSMGTVEERHILIQVYEKPRITSQAEALEGIEGESVTLRCSAFGKPPPEYSWSNERQEDFSHNERDRFRVDKYKGSLLITDLRKEDQGNYTCLARNPAGHATLQSSLVVVTKPRILDFANVTGQRAGNSVLICRAVGDPPPDIRFIKQGNRDPFRVGSQSENKRLFFDQLKDPKTGITVATLKIADVSRSDDGLYQCISYNNKAQSNRWGHFTVQFPPSFLNTPMKEAWSWDGRPVNMTCVAEAIPNATITWFIQRGMDENEQVAVDQYTPNVKQIGVLSHSTLQVSPVSREMYGVYKCLAINKLGTAEHKMRLREARKPGPMLEAIVYEKTPTSMSYKLVGPVEDGGLPVKSFFAQYRKHEDAWSKPLKWPVDRMIFTIDGLEPVTLYWVRFAAENEVGLGKWSLEKREQTPRPMVPEKPRILNELVGDWALTAYPDKFQLFWKLPQGKARGVEGYEIWYEPVKNISVKTTGISEPQLAWESVGAVVKVRKSGTQPRFMLRDLQSNTFYRVKLMAKNDMGNSQPDEIVFKTATVPGEAWRPLRSPVTATATSIIYQRFLQSSPVVSFVSLALIPLIHINTVISIAAAATFSISRPPSLSS